MRLKIILGVFIFVCGLYLGTFIDNSGRIKDEKLMRYHNISLQSGLKLAFSSYLRACTVALDATHTPGDQFQKCNQLAHTYMENNIYSILRQLP